MSLRLIILAWFWTIPAFAGVTNHFHFLEGVALGNIDTVQSGDMKPTRRELSITRLLRGHQIFRGNRAVLIIRRYWDGDGMIDADTFTKISIEVPIFVSDSLVKFDVSSLRTYFSRGSSSWGDKEGGVYATSLNGWITILRRTDYWQVRVELSGKAQESKWGQTIFHDVTIKDSFDASRINYEALTPWLGADFSFGEWRRATKPQ